MRADRRPVSHRSSEDSLPLKNARFHAGIPAASTFAAGCPTSIRRAHTEGPVVRSSAPRRRFRRRESTRVVAVGLRKRTIGYSAFEGESSDRTPVVNGRL